MQDAEVEKIKYFYISRKYNLTTGTLKNVK